MCKLLWLRRKGHLTRQLLSGKIKSFFQVSHLCFGEGESYLDMGKTYKEKAILFLTVAPDY